MSNGRREAGFTYLGVILLVAALGAGLAATAQVWSHARQRDKEMELLWIGNQFRQAIGVYYQRTPGAVKRYPERLEDLLEDRRYASVQRYLRRVYRDPMTGSSEWGVVQAPEGGIAGVHSLSERRVIKQLAVELDSAAGATYRDLRFVYRPAEIAPRNLRR